MKKLMLIAVLFFSQYAGSVAPVDPFADKKPKVSIITSLFKGDDFIAGFLSDIVRQTIFDECELIIINANSPGREEPIIRQYMKRFPNIIYKKLDHDPGLYAVWNMAIKMARGDFITNANVDDRRNPQCIEIQARALEQNPCIDLVYANYLITEIPNETFEHTLSRHQVNPFEFSPQNMYKCLPGPQPMWRKVMHEKAGYFDETFKCGGDFEMWNRAVSKGSQFKKIPGHSGVFYINPHGLSTDVEKKAIQDAELQKIVDQYQGMWVTDLPLDTERIKSTPTHHTPQYYCTAADDHHFALLLNLIGSIHRTNFDQLGQIAVFDLGLSQEQINYLKTVEKVSVRSIKQLTHPDLLTRFTTIQTSTAKKMVPGWYAWKFVILKEMLDEFPYALWVDAGTTIFKPLDILFNYIKEAGYFLCTMGDKVNNELDHDIRWGATAYVKAAFDLASGQRRYVLDQEPLLSGTVGVSRKAMEYLVMPLYNLTYDLRLFEDDGSTPNGFGTGRHDQTVLSIFAYLNGLTIHHQDHTQQTPIFLNIDGRNEEFYITWHGAYVNQKTCLYNSRWDLRPLEYHCNAIRYILRPAQDDRNK